MKQVNSQALTERLMIDVFCYHLKTASDDVRQQKNSNPICSDTEVVGDELWNVHLGRM